MGLIDVKCLIFITGFLLSGTLSKEQEDSKSTLTNSARTLTGLTNTAAGIFREGNSRLPTSKLAHETEMEPLHSKPKMDATTPITGVPAFDPSNPAAAGTMPTFNPIPTANPYTAPGMGTPMLSTGQSWCIASQTASQTALQVALDYACGYGGADCSEIQPGANCYNPDTVRDHASYAFNSYYQKNPIQTSCDFGGTAIITNVNPSTSTCQYPSSSMSSSALNTTIPTGSSIYGSVPPDSTSREQNLRTIPLLLTLACFIISMAG
ncbi:glucan endo-1,3-beta-glucosidase 1-like [Phalaenopsis equestris]|uniref:glucan endo-1,3-beta-glucosidase 1-like n=1 Tax=Phalaenopsis equestris TaxID=78828 RepID=UPI0009E30CCE|nr:glucan endo-1,3-beta-glucosidase 1-like [Phalaenopsis equestris]